MTLALHLETPRDWDALGAAWEALEARAEASVFQSWAWVGCLAAERYEAPLLVRAEAGGACVGLALFNRAGGALHLHESGDPARDRPFIEHNGPLVARGGPPGTRGAMLAAALRAAGGGGLRLSGVPADLPAEAGGVIWHARPRPAPWVDLDAVRAAGGDWLATLSANARAQMRRSDRLIAEAGPIAAQEATSPEEASRFLDELMALHAARWDGRGQGGAFATPFLRRFHAVLVQRLLARGMLELLRVTAGGSLVGVLYNLRRGGMVSAYQSGWAAAQDPQRKPGLACHHQAIRRALARGDRGYDFLAGEARYKTSLANASRDLVWATVVPRLSLRGLVARMARRGGAAAG
jgi:CelD/BcsL family acetyltransferase involved in cellulose biosynthesis